MVLVALFVKLNARSCKNYTVTHKILLFQNVYWVRIYILRTFKMLIRVLQKVGEEVLQWTWVSRTQKGSKSPATSFLKAGLGPK